ncbi:hypothetical protein B2G88_12880 [Natronolimnobius baerhuensis]|uniref:Uncharacterized protein n=1 Tax=Natronolimnobius baerhuensis TaxID=253108 RepID=A0A202E575_9EURY|nr:hypothetical protein B2G88_12880 [Natronolimnobius baerhuensis]
MTDWSQYLAYKCRHCREDCINPRNSEFSRDRECRTCGAVPELEDAEEIDSYQLDAFDTPSEGESAIARSARGANARAQIADRRKRGLAPDPEARAHSAPRGRANRVRCGEQLTFDEVEGQ